MTIFNSFKEDVLSKVHDLQVGVDDIKVTLHTAYTPDIDAHQLWADAGVSSTEYPTADGYTQSEKSLANQSVTADDAGDRALFDADDLTWAALGALTPATPSDAIIWNTTPAAPLDPLICYVELGATATNGGDYTLAWSSSPAAIISLT